MVETTVGPPGGDTAGDKEMKAYIALLTEEGKVGLSIHSINFKHEMPSHSMGVLTASANCLPEFL